MMSGQSIKKSALYLRNHLRGISLYGIYLSYEAGVNSQTFKGLKGLFGGGFATQEKFGDFVVLTVQILLVVAGSVAVIFLILGGYRYIVAHGNEEQTEAAKKTLTGAIIGIVIITLAFAIIAIISNILVAGDAGFEPTP